MEMRFLATLFSAGLSPASRFLRLQTGIFQCPVFFHKFLRLFPCGIGYFSALISPKQYEEPFRLFFSPFSA
jgi:hypothetical protein